VQLVSGHVNAVTEQSFRPEEIKALIDAEVMCGIRIKFARIGDFIVVFVDVCLQMAPRMFPQQASGSLKLLRCRGDRETRRDHIFGTAPFVPLGKQSLAVVIRTLRCVAERRRRVAVHHGFAAEHHHAPAFRFFEIGVDRVRMAGAIGNRRGRAMRDQGVVEMCGDPVGMRLVGKFLLGRKRVVVEPVQQLVRPGGNHLRLRKVDMRVDETGKDQMRAVIYDLHLFRYLS